MCNLWIQLIVRILCKKDESEINIDVDEEIMADRGGVIGCFYVSEFAGTKGFEEIE
jgi:hypothetical protein